MNIDKLVGIDSDIEREIYEDQLRHLNQGILVSAQLVKGAGEGLAKDLIHKNLIFSIKNNMGQYYKIRGVLAVDSMVCLFDNDLIRVEKYDDSYFEVYLIKGGKTRQIGEKENFIFEPLQVKSKHYLHLKDYLKNLTIESFVQFNYVSFFQEIGISDDFFVSINIQNYESKEEDFKKKMRHIVEKELFSIELEDIYFHVKGLQFFKGEKISFLNKDLVVLKNKWITTERFKV